MFPTFNHPYLPLKQFLDGHHCGIRSTLGNTHKDSHTKLIWIALKLPQYCLKNNSFNLLDFVAYNWPTIHFSPTSPTNNSPTILLFFRKYWRGYFCLRQIDCQQLFYQLQLTPKPNWKWVAANVSVGDSLMVVLLVGVVLGVGVGLVGGLGWSLVLVVVVVVVYHWGLDLTWDKRWGA